MFIIKNEKPLMNISKKMMLLFLTQLIKVVEARVEIYTNPEHQIIPVFNMDKFLLKFKVVETYSVSGEPYSYPKIKNSVGLIGFPEIKDDGQTAVFYTGYKYDQNPDNEPEISKSDFEMLSIKLNEYEQFKNKHPHDPIIVKDDDAVYLIIKNKQSVDVVISLEGNGDYTISKNNFKTAFFHSVLNKNSEFSSCSYSKITIDDSEEIKELLEKSNIEKPEEIKIHTRILRTIEKVLGLDIGAENVEEEKMEDKEQLTEPTLPELEEQSIAKSSSKVEEQSTEPTSPFISLEPSLEPAIREETPLN